MVLSRFRFQDELMRIPLAGIVAILSRSDLGVASEEAVYEFLLRWAFLQYPNSEERHKILSFHLLPLVPRNTVTIDKPICRITFSIPREKCSTLFPSRSKYCRKFRFAGHVFSFWAQCKMDSYNCFGLLFEMLDNKWPLKGTIDFKFEAKTRPSLQYVTVHECTSTDREAVECKDLFGIPWSQFIADDSPFFIDDRLYLQIHLKMT